MTRSHDARVAYGTVLALAVLYVTGAVLGWGSPSASGWVSAWATVAAGGAAAGSLIGASLHAEGGTRRSALRYLGLAAASWALGSFVHAITENGLSRAAAALSFADLFWLAAVPLFAIGAIRLAPLPRGLRARLRHGADTYIATAAVFSVSWALAFAPLYEASGESPFDFFLELIHPVADVALLLALVPLVLWAPRGSRLMAFTAVAALGSIACSDVLFTVLRLSGTAPERAGVEQLGELVGYLLLSVLPLLGRGAAPAAPRRLTGRGLYRFGSEIVAGTAVAGAALILTAYALLRDVTVQPVVALAAGSAALVTIVRVYGLIQEITSLRLAVDAGDRHFRALAEGTGDVVLIVDFDGRVRYASPGAPEKYGYGEAEILGRSIEPILHPEDLPQVRAALKALGRGGDRAVHLSVRVLAADGTWRHTESTLSRYHRPGGDVPQGLLVASRDISDQVALQQQVDHLTFHDGLTGLSNRSYFEERTREVLARGPADNMAVLFLDLDGFTAVNDSAGHGSGDYLLAQAARRLRATVQVGDTTSRWGGDEFAVLVERRGEAEAVVDLAERLVRVVSSEPFRVAGRDIALTASVGIAFAEEGVDASELLRNADLAMARAKDAGGDRVELFAAHMHADVVRRLELQSDLQRALAERQFAIEYQPVVELATSRVTGVEALVRWWRGSVLISPDEFIGPAEESGLIVPLGAWVLQESCKQVATWREQAWDISLSVNLSARQISAPRFVETVAEALEGSGLPASALTLEVTEEVLVEDGAEAVDRLRALRELGVRLAIDDFGTGYASLAYLRQLPVDIIKIDPSFTAGLGEDDTVMLLTRTIVRLGQDLGLVVVAEGIERPEQLDLLREMGCARGQGYLVARPMGVPRVESMVRTDVDRRGRPGLHLEDEPGRTPASAG
ncbi:MAG: EAL domain-containing protein [Streptosporangiales bacterium]|nr:EAL domain-containing protein [Streptosporangiales bacterium]